MENNTANLFDAAATAIMHEDSQCAVARPDALNADQMASGYPTLAKYLPVSYDTANTGDTTAPPALDQHAREAVDLMAQAAILRASADMERGQLGADLERRLTQHEFIERYCKRNNVTPEGLSRHRVALPCACGDDSCEGWALVQNDTQSILEHENGPDGA